MELVPRQPILAPTAKIVKKYRINLRPFISRCHRHVENCSRPTCVTGLMVSQSGACVNRWQSQCVCVCRMPSAYKPVWTRCCCWLTVWRKIIPRCFSGPEEHTSKRRWEEKINTRPANKQQRRDRKDERWMERLVLGRLWGEGSTKTTLKENHNAKTLESTMKTRADTKKRGNKSNRRQERLPDIFSSSLVRDVLYSAGWSLRWGPLEIIMAACCFRQPAIYKRPLLSLNVASK